MSPGSDRLETITTSGDKIYVGGSYSYALDIQGTIIESSYPDIGNNSNPFIIALTNGGNVEWIDLFHCGSGSCRELAIKNDRLIYTVEAKENIWLQQVGTTDKHIMKKSTGLWDAYLGCINANSGIAIWDNLMGSSGSDFNYCLDVNDKKIVTGGHFINEITFESQDGNFKKATSNGSYDAYFCQYSLDGNLEWIYSIGAEKADGTFGDVVINQDGELLATGYFMSPEITIGEGSIFSGGTESYMLKLSQFGEVQWVKQTASSENYSQSFTLSQIPSGDFLFIGYARGNFDLLEKNFNLEAEYSDQLIYGVISETTTSTEYIVDNFYVYPNPVIDQLNVSAAFPVSKLILRDLSGKAILISENEKMDLSSVKKGIYLLQVEGGNQSAFQRIIKE